MKRTAKTPAEKKESRQISLEDYKKNGANINFSKEEVFKKSDIILKLNCLSVDEANLIKSKSIFIAQFDPNANKDVINKLIKNDIKIFSLNLLPRITRAQSMDVLSSQANLAGYKAVIESFSKFEKAIPMMMTAAGTVPAAKVLVIGAGVAGLQAIATAKRLGAIVSATDVRATSKEQVESLGGKFLTVEQSENLETAGGYAKEAGEDFKKRQAELLKNFIKKSDIAHTISTLLDDIQATLFEEAKVFRAKNTHIVSSYNAFNDVIANKGGIVRCVWAGTEETEKAIKA